MAIDESQFSLIKLAADTQWLDMRIAYDSSNNIEYKGVHKQLGASTGDKNWLIWKYTWSSGNLERIEGPLIGSWEGRATLGW